MKISLCIPMYNEQSIIESTVKATYQYMSTNFEDFEILFSNDGSRDKSAEIVKSLELPNVRVCGYEVNKGKGCAVRTAMLEATGDIRIFTDADLAYGLDVVGTMVKQFHDNPQADMIIGSRNLHKDGYEGYTFIRKLASKMYIKVLALIAGFKLTDSQSGCKGFRGDAANKIFSRCEVNGFAFDFELLLWSQKLNLTVQEMPVKIINHRESKISLLRDSIKMTRDLLKMKMRISKTKV